MRTRTGHAAVAAANEKKGGASSAAGTPSRIDSAFIALGYILAALGFSSEDGSLETAE